MSASPEKKVKNNLNTSSSQEHLNPGRSFILLSLPNGKREKFERDIVEKGWKAVFYKVDGRIDFANNNITGHRSPTGQSPSPSKTTNKSESIK